VRFSPIFATSARRRSSTLVPSSGSASSAARSAGAYARELAREPLELVAAGDEVGLRIDLEEQCLEALARDRDGALGGDALRLLVGLRETGFAHQFRGRVEVAAGLDERLLALHHPGAGAFTQLLDGFRCHVHR
jgi:hypothetical protein